MKKLATILLLFVSFNLYSQFNSAFESGYRSYHNRLITDESNRFHLKSFYSTFYFGYKFHGLKINTETSIYFGKAAKLHEFSPKYSEFKISFSYTIKNISFSYSHLCGHPIVNNMSDFKKNRIFFESYDRISIRVKLL